MINKMTDEERKEAARVMASDGPWDFRARGVVKWEKAQDTPPLIWDWFRFEYRIRPAEPAPLPCCPCCHGTQIVVDMIGRQRCVTCDAGWWQERRAPCPSCADEGKRELRRQRDEWRNAATQAEARMKEEATQRILEAANAESARKDRDDAKAKIARAIAELCGHNRREMNEYVFESLQKAIAILKG